MNVTALQGCRVDMLLFQSVVSFQQPSPPLIIDVLSEGGGKREWGRGVLSLEATCPDPAIWNRDQSSGLLTGGRLVLLI